MDPRSQRDYIVALADDDPARRVEAARALYHWGCLAVEPALKTWRSDAELAALLGQALTVGIAVRPDTFERIHKAWGQPRLSSVPPSTKWPSSRSMRLKAFTWTFSRLSHPRARRRWDASWRATAKPSSRWKCRCWTWSAPQHF